MLNKKVLLISLIIILIIVILYITLSLKFKQNNQKQETVLENPLKKIVLTNTNKAGILNTEKITEQALNNFNQDYINYLLLSLEVNMLHKSNLGYGNPDIKLILDEEIWTAEINDGILSASKHQTSKEDIIIQTSKKEIINILLSKNIRSSIENSLKSGKIEIKLVADKIELTSKGYLSMYNKLFKNKN